RYDALSMQVVSTQPTGGAILPPPLTALDIQLNEAIDPTSLSASDLTLSIGTVIGATLLNDHTIRFTLSGLNQETPLNYSIAAGALADLFGNPSQPYSGSLQLDVSSTQLPTPLVPTSPLGSLVYAPVANGLINFTGDSDTFTISLEPNQQLSLLVAGD